MHQFANDNQLNDNFIYREKTLISEFQFHPFHVVNYLVPFVTNLTNNILCTIQVIVDKVTYKY